MHVEREKLQNLCNGSESDLWETGTIKPGFTASEAEFRFRFTSRSCFYGCLFPPRNKNCIFISQFSVCISQFRFCSHKRIKKEVIVTFSLSILTFLLGILSLYCILTSYLYKLTIASELRDKNRETNSELRDISLEMLKKFTLWDINSKLH